MKLFHVSVVLSIVGLAGCSTPATLTVYSQPMGAFITEQQTGNAFGAAPVVLQYDLYLLKDQRDADGCFLVKGLAARWVSGVTASLENVRICGSPHGNYQISFHRDPNAPGLEKDMQFALQVQNIRAQQAQAEAAQAAALLGLFNSTRESTDPVVLDCQSRQIRDTVYTECR